MSLRGHLGNYNTATSRTHVRFGFSTHEAAGANVAPSSAFEAADLRIYKATDGAALSATQRSSANGITMTSPFDSLTGVHTVDIDLADDTDSGFWASGCYYEVWLCPDETVDGQTITGVCLCSFEVGVPAVDATHWGGTIVTSATVRANMLQVNGTNQTAGDIPAELAKVPKSDGTTGWNATARGQIQSEAEEALTARGYTAALSYALRSLKVGGGDDVFVGDTGNTTTTLHLPDFTSYGDDALNDLMIIVSDASTGSLPYVRWIIDWDQSDALATLDSALPFTPEDSTDTVLVYAFRRDTQVALVKAKTDLIPASPASVGSAMTVSDKTGFKLASDGLDSVLVESGITEGAGLTNDTGTQLTSINARQAFAIIASAATGVLAGASGANPTFKPAGKPSGNTRVDATVASTGRTAVNLKVPD